MVDEEQTKETEPTSENTGEGVQSKTTETLDRAESIVERQERANTKHEELITREENLKAQNMVGGTIDAGQTNEKKEEVSPKDYAKQALDGKFNE